MKVSGRDVLHSAVKEYPIAKTGIATFLRVAENAEWDTPDEVRSAYAPKKCTLRNGLWIFGIKGGQFRLIAKINFPAKALRILWFGSHDSYDRLDLDRF